MTSSEKTTIQLDKDTLRLLKKAKVYSRQTYNDLIREMGVVYLKLRERNEYDEFLHHVQQPKMKELWDNPDDEVWNRV